jgi:transposase-like protein
MENSSGSKRVKRTQRDYSLAFKLQVVDEVEKGHWTYKAAQRRYGIQGRSTVLIWCRKHGTLDWNRNIPVKAKKTPKDQIKELQRKIARLEEEKLILNRAIDIADEMFDTEIRKKYLLLSLEASKKQEKKDDQQSE